MRFSVIIGNPPYQKNDGGGLGTSAIPLYHLFVEKAIDLQPDYVVMITPSRWFAAGRNLDSFRAKMLKDVRLKCIHDFPNACEIFPNVEIKGGVNYFLWDKNYRGLCLMKTYKNGVCVSSMFRDFTKTDSEVFIRDNESLKILQKIKSFGEKSFSELVSARNPFGLESRFRAATEPFEGSIKVYATKIVVYTTIDKISRNVDLVYKHKVLVPYGIGSGNGRTDKVNPIYAPSGECCTDTYLVIGGFDNKEICDNIISYINTKFFHFCLSVIKNTQNTPRSMYRFVPQQDFSKSWNDKKLYKKYNLTEDEIKYIESSILVKNGVQ